MVDLLLIAGSALGALSVVMAVIAVAQTRAPRGAAIALMLAIIVFLIGAKMDPAAFNPGNLGAAWKRLFAGEISWSQTAPAVDVETGTAPVAAPQSGAAPDTAPDANPDAAPDAAVPAPATTAPAGTAP